MPIPTYPSTPPSTLTAPPPPHPTTLITFPTPQILLVTINRPNQMNCIATAGHWEMHRIWEWYDTEPSLRCAIVTGARTGDPKRDAFCAGQDLKEWRTSLLTPTTTSTTSNPPSHPPSGFAGLSQRTGKKPIISAIHGHCHGGGLEALLNSDLSLCTPHSTFSLPETRLGVAAFAGALPRLLLLVGLPRASELALTGRVLTATEAENWGIVNRVVEGEVVEAAVEMARKVAGMSPDSVIVTREGLRSAWGRRIGEAVEKVWGGVGRGLLGGVNIKEGLGAFVERREPVWVDSKL